MSIRKEILGTLSSNLLNFLQEGNGYQCSIKNVNIGFENTKQINSFPSVALQFGTEKVAEEYESGNELRDLDIYVYFFVQQTSTSSITDEAEKVISDFSKMIYCDSSIIPDYHQTLINIPEIKNFSIKEKTPYLDFQTNTKIIGVLLNVKYLMEIGNVEGSGYDPVIIPSILSNYTLSSYSQFLQSEILSISGISISGINGHWGGIDGNILNQTDLQNEFNNYTTTSNFISATSDLNNKFNQYATTGSLTSIPSLWIRQSTTATVLSNINDNIGIGTNNPTNNFVIHTTDVTQYGTNQTSSSANGTVYSSGNPDPYPQYPKEAPFYGTAYFWVSAGTPAWLAYKFNSPKRIAILKMQQYYNYGFLNFSLLGSNDSTNGIDGTWTTLASNLNTNQANQVETIYITNLNSYIWYKISGGNNIVGACYVNTIQMINAITIEEDTFNINNYGNVGIGSTSLKEKLNVNGNVSVTGNIYNPTKIQFAGTTSNSLNYTIGFPSNWSLPDGSGGFSCGINADGNGLDLHCADSFNCYVGVSHLYFDGSSFMGMGQVSLGRSDGVWGSLYTHNITDTGNLWADGNVGINTRTPTEKFSVSGNLSVTGNIYTNGLSGFNGTVTANQVMTFTNGILTSVL